MCLRRIALFGASLLMSWGSLAHGAGEYPFSAVLDAHAETATAKVTSQVTISIDRLMEESRRVRVLDGLKYGGYPRLLNTLRALPPIGTIRLAAREVEIRYAVEQPHARGRRVVLVADHPLFFLAGDPDKARAGYELTIVELIIDAKDGVTGTMTGAARVKPDREAVLVVDDFAEAPVRLTGRIQRR